MTLRMSRLVQGCRVAGRSDADTRSPVWYRNWYRGSWYSKEAKWQTEETPRNHLANLPLSGEDRTPIELFIAGIRDWDTGLRGFLDASADGK